MDKAKIKKILTPYDIAHLKSSKLHTGCLKHVNNAYQDKSWQDTTGTHLGIFEDRGGFHKRSQF